MMREIASSIASSQVAAKRDRESIMPGRANERPMSKEEYEGRCALKKFDLEATLKNIRDSMAGDRPNKGLVKSLIETAGKYVAGLRDCEDWLKKTHPGYFEKLDEIDKSLKDLEQRTDGNQFSRALRAIGDFLWSIGKGAQNIPLPSLPKIPDISPMRN